MPDFLQGFFGTAQAGVEAINDVSVLIRTWYSNRNPLYTRLRHQSLDRVDFDQYSHPYRARSTTLGAAVTSNSATTITVADTSSILNHDILELTDSATPGSSEYVQVNGDPPTANTLTVIRGVAVTTPLTAATNSSTVWLVGNSRNGAEILQTGLATLGTKRTQYAQTYQFPVEVGGSAQTTRSIVLPAGVSSPMDFNKTIQLQDMVDDIENTMYVGKKEAPNTANTVTAKSDGLRNILTSNKVTALTIVNGAAYTSTDLVRDTMQACRKGGGDPDLLVVSTDWMSGFSLWGQALTRIPAGSTLLGTPIKTFTAPFLGDIMVVEAPLLRPFTAFCLTSSEVFIRDKRPPFWMERGRLGDRYQGEWIAETALQVENESHHAWLEGITAFSAN